MAIPLLTLVLGLAGPSAHAGATCASGASHATLGEALADARCEHITLASGVTFEDVRIDRPVVIEGAGRDATFLMCWDGPCVSLVARADVDLVGLTVASEGVALDARDADALVLEGVRLLALGHTGGRLVLHDTDATLRDVLVEVPDPYGPPSIDAWSSSGHDLHLEGVRFLGTAPPPSGKRAIYAANVGVDATDCQFGDPRQMLHIPGTEIEGEDVRRAWGADPPSRVHWGEQSCGGPTAAALRACEVRCGLRVVASCTLGYDEATDQCLPEATCVSIGESPELDTSTVEDAYLRGRAATAPAGAPPR